jgi:hypothetical protein
VPGRHLIFLDEVSLDPFVALSEHLQGRVQSRFGKITRSKDRDLKLNNDKVLGSRILKERMDLERQVAVHRPAVEHLLPFPGADHLRNIRKELCKPLVPHHSNRVHCTAAH